MRQRAFFSLVRPIGRAAGGEILLFQSDMEQGAAIRQRHRSNKELKKADSKTLV